MKQLRNMALLSAMALLTPLCSLARDNNQRSVDISRPLQVGSTQLQPGSYKVEWKGTGPQVQVSFQLHGKTMATSPAMLHMNDEEVTEDAFVMNINTKALEEIDFGRQKEALIFGHGRT